MGLFNFKKKKEVVKVDEVKSTNLTNDAINIIGTDAPVTDKDLEKEHNAKAPDVIDTEIKPVVPVKKRKPAPKPKRTAIVKDNGTEESLEIVKKGQSITILKYEFLFRREGVASDSRYRIVGSNGSLVVTERELDFIYSEFKRFNKK